MRPGAPLLKEGIPVPEPMTMSSSNICTPIEISHLNYHRLIQNVTLFLVLQDSTESPPSVFPRPRPGGNALCIDNGSVHKGENGGGQLGQNTVKILDN